MFSDPFSNLMLVLLLFFCGLLVMFIFMMRNLESHWRNQEETRMQLALHLSDLEIKLDTLLRLAGVGQPTGAAPGFEPGFVEDADELLDFAANEAESFGNAESEPLYEQAVAPAWAGAQEYDAAAVQRELEPEAAPAGDLGPSLPEFLENGPAETDDRPEGGERHLDPEYR